MIFSPAKTFLEAPGIRRASTLLILSLLVSFNFHARKPVEHDIRHFKQTMRDHIHSFSSGERNLLYAENGDPKKRPVLFVHGSPGGLADWYSYLLDPSLLEDFHLLTIDRPGYGRGSGKPLPSIEEQAKILWDFLKSQGHQEKPILVGYSFGGAVIAKMAQMKPEDVHGLLFVSAAVDPELEKIPFHYRVGSLWGIQSLLPRSYRTSIIESEPFKSELENMQKDWGKMGARSVVIHGTKDDIVSVRNTDFLKQKLSPEEIIILEGMDHFILWKRLEIVKDALRSLRDAL